MCILKAFDPLAELAYQLLKPKNLNAEILVLIPILSRELSQHALAKPLLRTIVTFYFLRFYLFRYLPFQLIHDLASVITERTTLRVKIENPCQVIVDYGII